MTGIFKPRLEILPPEQQRLWPELNTATALGFVFIRRYSNCVTAWTSAFC